MKNRTGAVVVLGVLFCISLLGGIFDQIPGSSWIGLDRTNHQVSAGEVPVDRYGTFGSPGSGPDQIDHLDASYANNGVFRLSIGSDESIINGAELQQDGKIVTAGQALVGTERLWLVTRHDTNGALDPTFGVNGKVYTNFDFGTTDTANSIAVQPDGKIVVGGSTRSGSIGRCALARYNSDGSLDQSFGSFGLIIQQLGSITDDCYDLQLQSDGKIVLVGMSRIVQGLQTNAFAAARFLSNGTIDSSFGINGVASVRVSDINNFGEVAFGCAIQTDGKIVLAGQTFVNGGISQIGVVRFLADGSLDPTFNGTGVLLRGHGDPGPIGGFAEASDVAIQADGKIVLAGRAGNTSMIGIQRINADGSPDAIANTAILSGPHFGNSVKVQTDGKIVVAGSTAINSGGDDFAAVRLNPDLTLDTSFSLDGKTRTDFGSGRDVASEVIVQPHGKLVLLGDARASGGAASGILRYEADGELDPSFGSNGIFVERMGLAPSAINAVAMQSDGKSLVAGFARNTTNDKFLARLDNNGNLDPTFGTGGTVSANFVNGDNRANGLTIQSDGKIIITGTTIGGFDQQTVARYNSDGTLDTTFNGTGRLGITLAGNFPGGNGGVAVDSLGRIFVVGHGNPFSSTADIWIERLTPSGGFDLSIRTDLGGNDVSRGAAIQSDGKLLVISNGFGDSNQDFIILRYNSDLSLDNTFSGDGKAFVDFGNDDIPYAIGVQTDGKIVVAGSASSGGNLNFAVTRLNTNGTLDAGFGTGGRSIVSVSPSNDQANALAIQPDGKIVIGGFADINGSRDIATIRLNSDGTLDSSSLWGNSGITTNDLGATDEIRGLGLQPDGKLIAAGVSGDNIMVARYEVDGVMSGSTPTPTPEPTPTPTPTPEPTPTPTPEPTPTPTPGDCITVSLPSSPVTGLPGTNITVPVTVSDVTGREVTSFDFTLEYDPSKLTFVGASNAGTVSNGYLITTFEQTAGDLVVSGFGTTDLSGAGVLLNLIFTVVGDPGECSTLDLTAFDFNEGTPCSITSDGEACALNRRIWGIVEYANNEEPTAVPNTTLTAAGSPAFQDVTDDIGAYYFNFLGPGSYTITPSKTGDNDGITAFDAALVVQRVVGMTAFTPAQTVVADVSGNGVITSFDAAQIARFVVGNPNTGATGEWRFDPVERNYPPSSTSLLQENYLAFLMGEVSGDWTPEEVNNQRPHRVNAEGTEPVAVSLPHTTFGIGATAVIPVTVSELTGRGLIAHQFEIAYDPTVIMPAAVPVDLAGTRSDGFNLAYNAATPGLLRVGIYGINDYVGEGTLVNLRFVGVGSSGSVSELRFVSFMFNENVDMSTVTDGSATVLAPTSAGVEVSGRVITPDGRGLRNATVMMTDGQGVTRTAVTSSFGYYRFEGVTVGESFVMSVNSRLYRFTPRVVAVTDTLTDVDFVGLE